MRVARRRGLARRLALACGCASRTEGLFVVVAGQGLERRGQAENQAVDQHEGGGDRPRAGIKGEFRADGSQVGRGSVGMTFRRACDKTKPPRPPAAARTRPSAKSCRRIGQRPAPSAGANGEFTRPRSRPGQEEVGDVDAGNQKDEPDRSQEHEQRGA